MDIQDRVFKMNGYGHGHGHPRPLTGLFQPHPLQRLYYGPDVVKAHLVSALPTEDSKAFIVTGTSLATKTPLIAQVEELLSPRNHGGTFSGIGEHAPAALVDEATRQVSGDGSIDTIISIGGGSPIDSAKAIILRVGETTQRRRRLRHIAIPTTLSAAECTAVVGTTRADGVKATVTGEDVVPTFVFYDPKFGLYTPQALFSSTGLRALDHAVESQYHPSTTWIPCRAMALSAVRELFLLLPKYRADPRDQDTITGLFLAAYASLAYVGQSLRGSLGLSHSLGYALGSPYRIPHGITSCMTLGHVVKLMARQSDEFARALAAVLPYIGEEGCGDVVRDADLLGGRILGLVEDLGLKTTLTQRAVGRDQLDVICARATTGHIALPGGNSRSLQEETQLAAVRRLVEGLW